MHLIFGGVEFESEVHLCRSARTNPDNLEKPDNILIIELQCNEGPMGNRFFFYFKGNHMGE